MSEWLGFVTSLKVEPFALLLMVSFHLKGSIFAQFVQDKTCMVSLGLPLETCFNITSASYFGEEASKNSIIATSNDYLIYASLVTTVPGVIATIFAGPWSDRFVSGRKWMMTVGALGFFLDSTIGLLSLVFFELPTPFLLFTNISSALLGGISVAYTAIYSYVAINTAPHHRAARFAILEVLVLIASPLSRMIVSQLMDSQPWVLGNRIRNYLALYVIDMTTSLTGMIWVILVIDETKMVDNCEPKEVSVSFANVDEDIPLLRSVSTKNGVSKMAPTFFDFESLKGVLKIIFKKRVDQPRFTLPLIILAHFIITMCKAASRLMLYQFCQMAFNWTMASYSNVTAFFTTLDIVAVIVTMPILKRLQVQDLTLCLIGTSSVLLGFLVRGLIITDIGYYIACIANIYMPLSTIASRSLLSSVADKTETGSVFAVTECLDTFAPLLSSILFTQIFNATMSSYIGAALLFGAALSAISLSIYVKLLADTAL